MNPLLAPQMAAPPQTTPNALTPMAASPAQAPAAQSTPEEMAAAMAHMQVVASGLMGLVGKPQGQLTRKDALEAGADMLKNPDFSNPDARNALLGELLNLPQDEQQLRQVLGQHLLHSVAVMQAAKQQMGGGQPAPQGAPDAGA